MPSTILYRFGDVVLVAFPFTNQQSSKKRPAVVISRETYQQSRLDDIVMAVTSQIRRPVALDEAMLQDWSVAGLVKPSIIKPLIATFEQGQIVKAIGRLSGPDRVQLSQALQSILGD